MTVVDSRDPGKKLVIDLGPIEAAAGELAGQAEAVAERTRLLVINESLGNSFGSRDTDAAESYRSAAEVFGTVAGLLRDELDRGRAILLSVTRDYRDTDADGAAALARAAGLDPAGEAR